jgi:hypothetical protein
VWPWESSHDLFYATGYYISGTKKALKPPPRDSLSPSLPVVVVGRHPGPFHIGQAASQRDCLGLTRARKLAVLVGTCKVMSTVYGIVKQNDGFINVYSEPGKDTTFKIQLSRHGGEASLIDAQDVTEIPGGLGETVLIVEEEESILKMTQMMLERMGYKVLVADTPGEAIVLAREEASIKYFTNHDKFFQLIYHDNWNRSRF